MKKVFKLFLAVVAMTAAAVSCTKETTPLSYDGDTVLKFGPMGETKVITVKSDNEINVTSSAKWAKVSNLKNDVTIEVSIVPDESSRKATVTVSNGVDTPIEFEVRQEGAIFDFDPKDEYTLSLDGGTIEIPYTTNLDFSISSSEKWLKVTKGEDKVVLTVEPATEAHQAVVSYEAGNNAGEFTVKQFNPVEISVEAYLKEWSSSFNKKNTVSFTVKGVGVTAGALTVVTTDIFGMYTEDEWAAKLAVDEVNALDADDIKDINSAEGYSNGYGGQKDGTEYYVVVYATNGSDSKLVYDNVTTEKDEDPLSRAYSVDEIGGFETKDAIYGTYDFYANVHVNAGKQGWGSITRPTKLGTITISDGGSEEYQGKTYEYVKVSGFYKPFVNYIKAAGGSDFVAEDSYWFARNIEKLGWVVYPENGGFVNTGTPTEPNYKYYEFVACGDGYLRIPDYYPLVGGVADNGIFAFCDTGSLDEDYDGFDSWYLCGITMSGGQIAAVTGQYTAFSDWILVPQAAPTSASYKVTTNCYKNYAQQLRASKVAKLRVSDVKASAKRVSVK